MSEHILTAIAVRQAERLDKYLSETVAGLTRTQAAALIEAGNCSVNGVVVSSKKSPLKSGDRIVLNIPEPEPAAIQAEDIPLDVRYEDGWLIVVNKPRGMVVHPSHGHHSGTLVNGLMWRCGESLSGINGVIRPGIVHRIDRDTSGLLAVAKNDAAHLSLAEQLKAHTVTREYHAVVHGRFKEPSGTVDAPIGRSASDRKKMWVTDKGVSREAVTHYETVSEYRHYTHVRLRLQTGRTHQIRVHMAYMGHPVAGDAVYGKGNPAFLKGQCLHAKKLGFIHPESGEYMEVDSELPEYFEGFLDRIR